MLVEAGHFALALALGLSLIQFVVPLWGARANDPVLMSVGARRRRSRSSPASPSRSSLSRIAYVTSDFSVAERGGELPFDQAADLQDLRRVGEPRGLDAPVGADPEPLRRASWLLHATAFRRGCRPTRWPFRRRSRWRFSPSSSSPRTRSTRVIPAPLEGQDLNPLLQDPGLAIHPPLLYIGYVGFSISFAFACAALIDGRIDAVWARVVRPWTLTAWAFLTLGIAMGSYWAYYELGWGGWWFWDPVENASLMPWLAGTALVHSTVVMEKRDALKVWTILLAILTFSLSLLGTFLVRSGVLTSVHSFAVDPERGTFILGILIVFIGGSLALFAWRAPMLQQGGVFAPISREGALVLNNLFLATACATVFIGTLYPLALEVDDGRKDFRRRAVLQHDVRVR